MRITGGEFRGRRLRAPAGDIVRPTQDRVREALFNRLAPVLRGVLFLDLFAGSGAVGLEALSRGAARVIWIERDRRVWLRLCENVEALAGPGRETVCADALRWLRRESAAALEAEIVFADPPYRQAADAVRLLDALRLPGRLCAEGLLVLEQDAAAPLPQAEGWTKLNERVYGQTRLIDYRKTS